THRGPSARAGRPTAGVDREIDRGPAGRSDRRRCRGKIKGKGEVGATCTMAVSRVDPGAASPGPMPSRDYHRADAGSYPEGGGNLGGVAPNWGSGVLEMKKVFTTGQVAKICKVAPRTVSKWFDSGRLRGYRIPGSQDRRIPREHLLRFLKEHGMPLG